MNQVPMMQPVCPVQAPNYMLPQQPNYNAVKIDIHNPTVGTPSMAPCQPQYQPQYAPVNAPIYNYPQSQIYCPCQQLPADNTAAQAPVYYPGQPLPVQYPQTTTQYPYPQQPVIEQQNINYPQQPIPVPVQTQTTQVPAPQVSNAPAVEPPSQVEPAFDLNAFIARLSNPDFKGQLQALEEIADVVNNKPEQAPVLVDKQVYNVLNDIIAKDTSKLEGPSQKQLEIRQKLVQGENVSDEDRKLGEELSPHETAELNKSYALFSIALLDKIYANEVKKMKDGYTIPLTDLPSVVNVVNQLKDNSNPQVRKAAIETLSYLQDPEYKKDLTTLFTVAKNDQDSVVAEAAQEALNKLDQMAA